MKNYFFETLPSMANPLGMGMRSIPLAEKVQNLLIADFLNYMAAALASTFIGRAITGIGWNNLILILMGLMICGVVVALPYDKFKGRPKIEENT